MFKPGLTNPKCSICGGLKLRQTYVYSVPHSVNASTVRDVLLCKRCDLTPDPPVRRDR